MPTTFDIGESDMRRSMRSVFVCLLVAMMMYQPAVACHSCGGWGGGYDAPVYYGPEVYGGGCCGCGYETVVYNSCDNCGSCCGAEAVVTEGAEAIQVPAPSTTVPSTGVQVTPAQPVPPPLPPPPARGVEV